MPGGVDSKNSKTLQVYIQGIDPWIYWWEMVFGFRIQVRIMQLMVPLAPLHPEGAWKVVIVVLRNRNT